MLTREELEIQLNIALKALKEYSEDDGCHGRSYGCCGQCGKTYTAEEALDKIKKIEEEKKREEEEEKWRSRGV